MVALLFVSPLRCGRSGGEAGVGKGDGRGRRRQGAYHGGSTLDAGLLVSAVLSLEEGKMANEYAPSEEILKVAEEGIRGMLNCVGGDGFAGCDD